MGPAWPKGNHRTVLLLAEPTHRLNARLIRQWMRRTQPGSAQTDITNIPLARGKWRPGTLISDLTDRLEHEKDLLLLPVRVVWLLPERNGRRSLTLTHFLTFRDPRYPGWLGGHFILARQPDRVRIVTGTPATVADLRQAWQDEDPEQPFGRFVVRRALLTLGRAERELRGARYKVPRLVRQDILTDPGFQRGLKNLAVRTDRTPEQALSQADRYLKEIAAAHSPFVLDLVATAIRWIYRQGFGAINHDPEQLHAVDRLAARHPIVFLPSHRSNLDRLALQYLLWDNDLPPNHTAGGINMSFFPVGPIMRRAGIFFIRRTFRDNPVYKHMLRSYIEYLIEKRFPIEWYIEGGRSRTGKMLTPRYGLLGYVADVLADGTAEDVYLIPTSIAYDQIFEMGLYLAELQGRDKPKENLVWLLRSLQKLRRRHGNIHIRIGEPLSLRQVMGQTMDSASPPPTAPDLATKPAESRTQPPADTTDQPRIRAVQKAAFEVCVRINRATPVTPASLTIVALLSSPEWVSLPALQETLDELVKDCQARTLPTTEPLDDLLAGPRLDQVLEILTEHKMIQTRTGTPGGTTTEQPFYRITPGRHLAAAYYRNTIIHFYLARAVAELSLAARADQPNVAHPVSAFWDQVDRLRDLLKFDFFFPGRPNFHQEIRQELDRHRPGWENHLNAPGAEALLQKLVPHRGPWVLRPFLEAYRTAAEELQDWPENQPWNERAFLKAALNRGHLNLRTGDLHAPDAVTSYLFSNALRLAENRGLLEPDAPDLTERRQALAEELTYLTSLLEKLSGPSESTNRV